MKKLKRLSSTAVESFFGVAFDRPVGATADVTELDYISALHQTDTRNGIRKDGSIQDVDISLFLSSRYGVNQTADEVEKNIFSGLGSTDRAMDMMQLVSLLLVPMLREKQEKRQLDDYHQNINTNDDEHGDTEDTEDDDDLLLYTVEMLLHDVTGSRQPKPLTRTLIKQIFQAYGEEALAQNEELVDAMLKQAGGGPGKRVLLDAKTFCKALTADVQEYDAANKFKLSTTWEDVMAGNDGTRLRKGTTRKNENGDDACNVPTMHTAPQIDNVADTFRSRPLIVFQWTFFVLSFQTYLIRELNIELLKKSLGATCKYEGETWLANIWPFFCTILLNITKWIIVMLAMSLAGVIYFGIGGVGNNLRLRNPLYPLIGTGIMLVGTCGPFYLSHNYREYMYRDVDLHLPQDFLVYATAILGSCAAVLGLWNVLTVLIPTASRLWKWLKCIVIPEGVHMESNIKQAASYKIDTMVKNALEVHRVKKQETVVPTHFGQALLNFSEMTPEFENVGGMSWLLRCILNKNLFRQEGVVFSGRLVSTNLIQCVVTIFILIFGIVLTQNAANSWEEAEDIKDNLPIALDEAVANELIDFLEDALSRYPPTEKRMVVVPLAVGVGIAFVCAFFITLMVLPSTSSTTLKFRSGVLPFVNDPRVRILRMAPDQTAFLRGVMFWGCLVASGLLGLVWAGLIFLYMWQVTARIFQQLTASLLGALIVIGVHALVTKSIRFFSSSGYYREKPLVANLTLLIRECGLVALTQSFVFIRVIRLFLTAIFYVGRLDSPFLYDSIGQVGHFRIDREPYLFRVEILQHEAHRHPFIETLGVMYLLKLRHRETFCSFAGSSWRLIFVYVLMPWLSKYRAIRRPLPELESDVEDGFGPPPAPLRAMTLVDPQAYALRAVSLVPVASGWAGGSSNSLGGRQLSVMSGGLSLLRDANVDDEVRELREEVERLQNQLRLTTLTPATAMLSRGTVPTLARKQALPPPGSREDTRPIPLRGAKETRGTRHTRSPPRLPEDTGEVKRSNRPGWEVESRGPPTWRPMSKIQESPPPPPPKARHVEFKASGERSPRPHSLIRKESLGLSSRHSPKLRTPRDDERQISIGDFTEISI